MSVTPAAAGRDVRTAPGLLPALALAFNALVWGVSWWPFRELQALGLHPLWATVLVYGIAVLLILATRRRALGTLLRTPSLWLLVLASGTTNAAFNWAMVIGDVVRVILLFYLMPLWAVLLSRLVLKEAFTPTAALRVALALAGAFIVLKPAGAGVALPLPQSLPDWLAVLGGFSFALNNVMLRHQAHRPEEARALAMFCGGVLVAGTLASTLASQALMPWLPAPHTGWLLAIGALSLAFLVSNLALQYGASRLPANVTSVVMLCEVVFATLSATALGAGTLTPTVLMGGALILAAALLSAFER
ncbi:EamA domain-containing membrane protein RarD [Rhizobacter sp. OV335]|nr:EamA domain-containing membrane protein RarD [Rhizobacter sp. OV335]